LVAGLFGKTTPLETSTALADFMDSRAAFLAQKCVVEFCRVRAGVHWQKLFAEADFLRELDRSRWRAYPPAYAMVAEMVEGALREVAGLRRRRLPAALDTLTRDVFRKYPTPPDESSDFWELAAALVHDQLESTQSRAPRPISQMPDPMARAVFSVLPMHKDVVTNDYDYIFNNLRMNLLRAHEDFLAAARLNAIANDLLGP
jgi:hypothetical protein